MKMVIYAVMLAILSFGHLAGALPAAAGDQPEWLPSQLKRVRTWYEDLLRIYNQQTAYGSMSTDRPLYPSRLPKESAIRFEDDVDFSAAAEILPSPDNNTDMSAETSWGDNYGNEGPLFNVSECDSDLYCEHIEGYPTEAIAAMVRDRANMITDIFSVYEDIKLQTTPKNAAAPQAASAKPESTVVNTRLFPQGASTATDEISLCESRSGRIFPKKAKNVNNEWVLVVNQENMTQGIWTEKCMNENGSCAYSSSFPGFQSFCKQKYSEYKLLSVNEVDGKMGIHTFRFPTCCACHLKPFAGILNSRNEAPQIIDTSPAVVKKTTTTTVSSGNTVGSTDAQLVPAFFILYIRMMLSSSS